MFSLKTITRQFRDRRAVTALEYGILAALIAVVIIASVTTLGTTLSTLFTTVNNNIPAG